MTEIARGRQMAGGYETFFERSRSRGTQIEPRGEKYGRALIRSEKSEAGPDTESGRYDGRGG